MYNDYDSENELISDCEENMARIYFPTKEIKREDWMTEQELQDSFNFANFLKKMYENKLFIRKNITLQVTGESMNPFQGPESNISTYNRFWPLIAPLKRYQPIHLSQWVEIIRMSHAILYTPSTRSSFAAATGVKRMYVANNGNCLFKAITRSLRFRNYRITTMQLREVLTTHLLTPEVQAAPDKFNPLETVDSIIQHYNLKGFYSQGSLLLRPGEVNLYTYQREMRKNGTWGEELMLRSASNYFNVPIVLVCLDDNVPYLRIVDTSNNLDCYPLVLYYINYCHFEGASDPLEQTYNELVTKMLNYAEFYKSRLEVEYDQIFNPDIRSMDTDMAEAICGLWRVQHEAEELQKKVSRTIKDKKRAEISQQHQDTAWDDDELDDVNRVQTQLAREDLNIGSAQVPRKIVYIKPDTETVAASEATSDEMAGLTVPDEKTQQRLPYNEYYKHIDECIKRGLASTAINTPFSVELASRTYKRFEIARHNIFQRLVSLNLGLEYVESLSMAQIMQTALMEKSGLEDLIDGLVNSDLVAKNYRTPDAYMWVQSEEESILAILDFTVSLNPPARHEDKIKKYQPFVDLLLNSGIQSTYVTIAYNLNTRDIMVFGSNLINVTLSNEEYLDLDTICDNLVDLEEGMLQNMSADQINLYIAQKKKMDEEDTDIQLGFWLTDSDFKQHVSNLSSWTDFQHHLSKTDTYSLYESLIDDYSNDSDPIKQTKMRLELKQYINYSVNLVRSNEWKELPIQPTQRIVRDAFKQMEQSCKDKYTILIKPKPSIPFAWPISQSKEWDMLYYPEYAKLDAKFRRMAIFSKLIHTVDLDTMDSTPTVIDSLKGIFSFLIYDNELLKQIKSGEKFLLRDNNDIIRTLPMCEWIDYIGQGGYKSITKMKRMETIIVDIQPNKSVFKNFCELAGVGVKKKFESLGATIEKKETLAWWDENVKYASENEFKSIMELIPKDENSMQNLVSSISLLYDNAFNSSMTANCGIRLAFTTNPYICLIVFSTQSMFDGGATLPYRLLIIEPANQADFKIMNREIITDSYDSLYGKLHLTKAFRLTKERLRLLSDFEFRYCAAEQSMQASLTSDNPGGDEKISIVTKCHLFMMAANIKIINSKLLEDAKYQFDNCFADYSKFSKYAREKMATELKNYYQVKLLHTIQSMLLNVNASKEDATVYRPTIIEKEGLEEIHGFGYKNSNLLDFLEPNKRRNLPQTIINEITIMYFLCPKNLHEHHHNMIKLHKTPLEIECAQRSEDSIQWCEDGIRTHEGITHSYNPLFVVACAELCNKTIEPKKVYVRKRIEYAGRRCDLSLRVPTMSSTKSSTISFEMKQDELLSSDTFPELGEEAVSALQSAVSSIKGRFNYKKVERKVKSKLINKLREKKKISKQAAANLVNKQFSGIGYSQITRRICRYAKVKSADAERLCREIGTSKFARTTCFIHENIKMHNEQEKYYENLISNILMKSLTDSAVDHNVDLLKVPTAIEKVPHLDIKYEEANVNEDEIENLIAGEIQLFELQITEKLNYMKQMKVEDCEAKLAEEIMDANYNLNSQARQLLLNTQADSIMSIVNKGQRTRDDREIYILSPKLKVLAYMIESTYKEINKNISEELISIPGDRKSIIFTKQYQSIESWKYAKAMDEDRIFQEGIVKDAKRLKTYVFHNNLDMTKYSNRDVSFKYALYIAANNLLKRNEKLALLACLFSHMEKEMYVPPNIINRIRDNKAGLSANEISENIFMKMTDQGSNLFVKIAQNWGQGVYNSMTSNLHSGAMKVAQLAVTEEYGQDKCKVWANVHSDDNLTSVVVRSDKPKDEIYARQASIIKLSLDAAGFTESDKKSNTDSNVMQMLSEYNFAGVQTSLWVKQIMLALLALPYIGLHEDLSACASRLQSAAAKGAPIQIISKVFKAMSKKVVKLYGFEDGADWGEALQLREEDLPLCMGGQYGNEYTTLTLCGPRSHHQLLITKLYEQLGGNILADASGLSAPLSDYQRRMIQTLHYCDQASCDLPEEYDHYTSSFMNPFQQAKFMKSKLVFNDPWSYIDKNKQKEMVDKFKDDYKLYSILKPVRWIQMKSYFIMLYNNHSFRFSISKQSELQLYFSRISSKYQKCVRIGQPTVIDGIKEESELLTPKELVDKVSKEVELAVRKDSDREIKEKLQNLFKRYVKADDRFKVTYHVTTNSEAVASIHQIGLSPVIVPNIQQYSTYINPIGLLFQRAYDSKNFFLEKRAVKYPTVFEAEYRQLREYWGDDLTPRQVQIAFNTQSFHETRVIFTPQIARGTFIDCTLALMSTLNAKKGVNQRFFLKKGLVIEEGRIRSTLLMSKERLLIQFADSINYAAIFFSRIGVSQSEIAQVLRTAKYCQYGLDDLIKNAFKNNTLARKTAVIEKLCYNTGALATKLYRIVMYWNREQQTYGTGLFEVRTSGKELQCIWCGIDQEVTSLTIFTRRGEINERELVNHFEKVYRDMSAYSEVGGKKIKRCSKTIFEVFHRILVDPKLTKRLKDSICLNTQSNVIKIRRGKPDKDNHRIQFTPMFNQYITVDQPWELHVDIETGVFCVVNQNSESVIIKMIAGGNANIYELQLDQPINSSHPYRYTELLQSGSVGSIMSRNTAMIQPLELLKYRRDTHNLIIQRTKWTGLIGKYFADRVNETRCGDLKTLPGYIRLKDEDEISGSLADSDFLDKLAEQESRDFIPAMYSSLFRPRRIGLAFTTDLDYLDTMYFNAAATFSQSALPEKLERKLFISFLLSCMVIFKDRKIPVRKEEEDVLITLLCGLDADVESKNFDKILSERPIESLLKSMSRIDKFCDTAEWFGAVRQLKELLAHYKQTIENLLAPEDEYGEEFL
jgi:hypothetical protein